MKKKTAAGLLCLALSCVLLVVLSLPSFKGRGVTFTSTYKETPVTLKGTYWESNGEYAALICPGYSCDRQKWRPMADACIASGLSTMTFDYSGQGQSFGTIGFDNAKTDAIPMQIDDAIETLHTLSGVDYDHILLIGHSMGGRAILRLLYDYHDPSAVTKTQKKDIRNVILLSPEVNYHYNAQASLFAGTSDESQEPWKSYSEECIQDTNVYLFGSTADDIVKDEDVLAIYTHIGGTDGAVSGIGFYTGTNSYGAKISAVIDSGVLHSYMMYSPKFTSHVLNAVSEITGSKSGFPAYRMSFVYLSWFLSLFGLWAVLSSLNEKETACNDQVPVLLDEKAFLLRKCLMWIPGLLMAFVLCCLTVVVPFGSPVMNTPYMCGIAGYGFVMLFAYRKGHFAGTRGTLPSPSLCIKGKNAVKGAGITVVLCLFVRSVLDMTMYKLIPLNLRLFWLLFATVIMTIGYYVSGCENDMLKDASRKTRILYNMIQYVPLFLLAAFYLWLKSYSGFIGQIQNLILMYIFCIPLGRYLRMQTQNRFLGAVCTAFTFQTLMITSAALISVFS